MERFWNPHFQHHWGPGSQATDHRDQQQVHHVAAAGQEPGSCHSVRHGVDAWHPRLSDEDQKDEAETAHVVSDGVAPNGYRPEVMANDYPVADAENPAAELLRHH